MDRHWPGSGWKPVSSLSSELTNLLMSRVAMEGHREQTQAPPKAEMVETPTQAQSLVPQVGPALFSYTALSPLANHKQGPLPQKGKHISLGTFSDMHAKLINMGRHASSRPAPHPRVHANKASPCPGDLHKALLLI